MTPSSNDPLTADEKRWMSATEVCRSCPHDPAEANPCACGIRWSCEADGGWAISDRWAVERAATPLGHEVPGAL